MRHLYIHIFLLFFILPRSSVSAGLSIKSETRKLMGTVVNITVISDNGRVLKKAISAGFSSMEKVDELMSTYKASSDISRVNRSAGRKPEHVDPMTFTVIERGIFWGDISGGAFDITVGKIKKLYKFDSRGEIPERELVKKELKSVGFKMVQAVKPDQVFLPETGMSIDLGGIAKGYAIEQALLSIKKEGVFSAMINAGGDIGTIGTKFGKIWKIGILHPRKRGRLLGVLMLKDTFVATSGDYMQFFEYDGERFSHIIDPRDGSASSDKMSVTVIAPSGADADALATTVYVLKKKEGLKLVEKIGNVEAMIVTRGGGIYYSSGFKRFLKQGVSVR